MATAPVEPGTTPSEEEGGAPNPTQLPIEPEFGPMTPPSEPEEPGVQHPAR